MRTSSLKIKANRIGGTVLQRSDLRLKTRRSEVDKKEENHDYNL